MVFGLLGLLIVLGNTVSIIMFWRRRFFMERSSILLINLSVADFIVGLVVIFTAIVGNLFLQAGSNGVKNIPITIIIPFDVFSKFKLNLLPHRHCGGENPHLTSTSSPCHHGNT